MLQFRIIPVLFALSAGAFPFLPGTCGEPYSIDGRLVPTIVMEGDFRSFVAKAVEDVSGDFEKIFSARPQVKKGVAGSVSNVVVLARGGSGWENYTIESLANNVLRITGSDDRGVMFGLYRFASDCLGVDPFSYWSGKEPKKSSRLDWKDGISIRQGDPSFKFRGWFINDEDFLNGFRSEENGVRKIDYPRYHVCFGPFLADKIYESAVRAGFNLMVCASYVDILNPDEKRLVDIASSRGLYLTMHHQEPVGAGALFLDLHFPEMKNTTFASHPDLWRKAWETYVREWAKVPDVIWQLGLRGRKDYPFWAVPGSDWGVASEAEDRRRAKLISDAMSDQIGIIRSATGGRPFHAAVQLWMEGADFYRRGLLRVPDGVMVMFSDNSPGLKFQPDLGRVSKLNPNRSYGLYCHLAVVCGNHHCELVPPFRTLEILSDAHAKGARELVLFNVSNLRPFQYTVSAAGTMTRDLASFDPMLYQRKWCAAHFGTDSADAASRAMDLFFAAYETEFSRDCSSSYGSPRERAPLSILNDGDMVELMFRLIARVRNPKPRMAIASPYRCDVDKLRDISSSDFLRVNQDMFPTLEDELRYVARASAQAASFRRCLDQVELAGKKTEDRRQLFERIGYPAGFMCAASECCAKLALAVAAREEGNDAVAVRHLESALAIARERDALDSRYNEGKWTHWYDRSVIYPYPELSSRIESVLKCLSESLKKECVE